MKDLRTYQDTSNELIVQRVHDGIQLIDPKKAKINNNPFIVNNSFHTVKSILQLPINVYFLNTDSVIQNINETTIATCGYESVKETIGKTITAAAKSKTADYSINHDREVLKTKKMIIGEESFERLDDINFQAITVKFPWYDNDKKIIGVFGFSITIGTPTSYPLSDALRLISKMGLLSTQNSSATADQILPGLKTNGIYLSKRESECLDYVLHGMTAKSIAKVLKLSPRTVEFHLENVKAKMNVSSIAELTEKYVDYNTLIQN